MRLPAELSTKLCTAVLAAAISHGAMAPASAALYCVPGVTAARCRGVFWETGKLYKKEALPDGPLLSADEYRAALLQLDGLRSRISALRTKADAGESGAVGDMVAKYRAEVRRVGEMVVDSLEGDERLDSRQRLLALVAVLDDIDAAALRVSERTSSAAPGFSSLGLLLEGADRRFGEFTASLPLQPADVDAP